MESICPVLIIAPQRAFNVPHSMKLLLDSDLATFPKQRARSLFIHSSLDFLMLLIHFRFSMALGN